MSYPPVPPNDPYRPEGEQPQGEPAPPTPPGPAYPGQQAPSGTPYPAPPGQPAPGPAPYGAEQGGYAPYPPPAQPPYGAPAQAPYGASPYPAPGGYGYFPRNDLGVWALVLGIASFVLSCGFFTGIPAIILGTKAKRAVEAGEANNGGLAQAGVILGWIASALMLLAIIAFVVLVIVGVASTDFRSNYY